jgi:hypothetical protein
VRDHSPSHRRRIVAVVGVAKQWHGAGLAAHFRRTVRSRHPFCRHVARVLRAQLWCLRSCRVRSPRRRTVAVCTYAQVCMLCHLLLRIAHSIDAYVCVIPSTALVAAADRYFAFCALNYDAHSMCCLIFSFCCFHQSIFFSAHTILVSETHRQVATLV